MSLIFKKLFSNKLRSIISSSIIATLIILPLLLFVFLPQSNNTVSPYAPNNNSTSIGLGITYLSITPQVARQFKLDVTSGALITEITPGSSADNAGIEVGDVVVMCNGVTIENTSLFGVIKACPGGCGITMKIYREGINQTVELFPV